MHKIIPLFLFIVAICYLYYGPAPMDKIGEIVKTRDCYQLKLMDEERLSLKKNKKNIIQQVPVFTNTNNAAETNEFEVNKDQNDNSLALSHRGN